MRKMKEVGKYTPKKYMDYLIFMTSHGSFLTQFGLCPHNYGNNNLYTQLIPVSVV